MSYLTPNPNKPILDERRPGFMAKMFRQWTKDVTERQLTLGAGSPEGVLQAVSAATYIDPSTGILYYKRYDEVDGDRSKGWEQTVSSDYWLQHAIVVIESTYGDVVSIDEKNKDLIKFGRNEKVGTSSATVAIQPTGTTSETYVSTNIIDTISSSSTSDGQVVSIEGHTISGGVFTFVKQAATLDGRNKVVLGTPIARCTRIENMGATDFVGAIYVYEDTAISSGVPSDDTKVHMQTRTGRNKSEKCSTTISNSDYWIITGFYGDLLDKTSAYAELSLEIREAGGVFKSVADISVSSGGGRAFQPFTPHVIAPKNSDVNVTSIADGANTDVSAGIIGVLAKVI